VTGATGGGVYDEYGAAASGLEKGGASANSTVKEEPGPNPLGTIISFNRPSGAWT